MIVNFKDKETQKIYNQEISKRISISIQKIALRKLIMLNNANSINDLKFPYSNHLEKLVGYDSKYSIRINDQYRICFYVVNNNFYDVEITDYH